MPAVEPRVLRGFRDYLPGEMIPRQEMLRTIERVFQRYGYAPLMTPALEYSDILLGKYGDEGDSLLYRFRDNGGRDVALRYDLTVPLARVAGQYPEIPRPFRRYQVAPVWRAEKPARGRFREFIQCDGDIVGVDDPLADAEIIQLGADMLLKLGVEEFRIGVNNRKILAGLMARINVAAGPEELAVLRTIDKLPKIGEEKTRGLLRGENGLAGGQIDAIFEFLAPAPEGESLAALDRLAGFFPAAGPGAQGVEELRRVVTLLAAAGLGDCVGIDLSIARGLNYYTGTTYETFLTALPGFGSVMSGGRYDGLIGVFARQEIPAVGISLGLDRLQAGLRELGVLRERTAVASILVTIFDAEAAPHAVRVASELRAAGLNCELYPQPVRLGKQLRYAERTGKRFAVICGPDEAARGVVQVKDLERREQEAVPAAELPARLATLVAREPSEQ